MSKQQKQEQTIDHNQPQTVPANLSKNKIPSRFKRYWIIGIVTVVVLGASVGGGLAYFYAGNDHVISVNTNVTQNANTTPAPQPTTGPKHLDGQIVALQDVNKYPVAVMIENLSPVRPQSGLAQAQVVYEALVEGGITRFMAVYDLSEKIAEIGPVRSARAYYIEWLSEYDALYAHAGGSPEALAAISGLGIHDLNQIGGAQGYYWRKNTVAAPHNLFTSTDLLQRALYDKKLAELIPDYQTWKFIDEPTENPVAANANSQALAKTSANTIDIDFSSPTYAVGYTYDAANKAYLRTNGGKPHLDKNTGQQIQVKNVVIVKIPPIVNVGDKGRLTLDVHGEGEAIVARFGEIITGTWKKPDREARTKFFDNNGTEIELGRGNTWVEIVPTDRDVAYQ